MVELSSLGFCCWSSKSIDEVNLQSVVTIDHPQRELARKESSALGSNTCCLGQ